MIYLRVLKDIFTVAGISAGWPWDVAGSNRHAPSHFLAACSAFPAIGTRTPISPGSPVGSTTTCSTTVPVTRSSNTFDGYPGLGAVFSVGRVAVSSQGQCACGANGIAVDGLTMVSREASSTVIRSRPLALLITPVAQT